MGQTNTEQLHPIVYRVYDAAGRLLYVGAAARPDRAPMALGPWYTAARTITLEHYDDPGAARAAAAAAVQAEAPVRHDHLRHALDYRPVADVLDMAQAQQRVVDALGALEQAEARVSEAVAAYRAAGASWRDVGAVVGSSRQAAAKRFGG